LESRNKKKRDLRLRRRNPIAIREQKRKRKRYLRRVVESGEGKSPGNGFSIKGEVSPLLDEAGLNARN